VIERQKNRAIEIHDSVLDALSLDHGDAALHFSHLYIHETEGVPGIDAGTGWSQEGKLTISTGIIEGSFSELPRDLWDGCLAMDGTVSENMIPVPLDYKGKIELRLESWAQVSEIISISGKGARLELIGEAEYVEEFKP
jgi:hypothetical protein